MAVLQPIPQGEQARDPSPFSSRSSARGRLPSPSPRQFASQAAPLIAKPTSSRRSRRSAPVVVTVVGLAVAAWAVVAATSAAGVPLLATSAVASTCGKTGVLANGTPCYCSYSGKQNVKVRVLGCYGKPTGQRCPHVVNSYQTDTTKAADYPFPHVTILSNHAVADDVRSLKDAIRDFAHSGSKSWEPDLKHSYLKNTQSGHYLELSHAVYKLNLTQ